MVMEFLVIIHPLLCQLHLTRRRKLGKAHLIRLARDFKNLRASNVAGDFSLLKSHAGATLGRPLKPWRCVSKCNVTSPNGAEDDSF
jgi:hypothetical protein